VEDLGIHDRINSVANPHVNARAELGVKTVKMMLMDIVSAKGILNRAVVSRAIIQLRHTPDRDSKLSQAKAFYWRALRETFCHGWMSGRRLRHAGLKIQRWHN
jgi:hypothetical protein